MGFASFNHHLAKWGFVLNDGKDFTSTIDAMGFRAIPRAEFEQILSEHGTQIPRSGRWAVEDSLAVVADAPPAPGVKS
jgi:leucyl/phenylalanyl-tRNA--protein transferase